jgi:hypothetical protein
MDQTTQPRPPLCSTNFVLTNGAKGWDKLFSKNHFNWAPKNEFINPFQHLTTKVKY